MNKVTLVTGDEFTTVVDLRIVKSCETIMGAYSDVGTDDPVPLPNMNALVLQRALLYLAHHADDAPIEADAARAAVSDDKLQMSEWDRKFIEGVSRDECFALILGANYLGAKELMTLGCKRISAEMKNKSTREIEAHFGLKRALTDEQEKQLYEIIEPIGK